MQVFKTYFKILKKMIPSILIYVIIFLGMTFLITMNIISGDSDQFKPRKVSAFVINKDEENEFIDGFIQYLDHYVVFKNIEEDDEAIKDALFYNDISYVLTIPKGFTKGFIAGEEISLTKQTAPNSLGAWSLDAAVNNYLNTAKLYLDYDPDITMEELNHKIASSLEKETKVTFDINKLDDEVSSSEFHMNYFNYLGYTILASFIIGVSSVMLAYQGLEIRRRHHASPISSRNFNAQLILGNLLFVLGFLVLFIIVGYLLNPFRRIDSNSLLYWANATAFSISTLSLSYLIALTVRSKNAVQAISTMVSLSLAFMTGIFVPQEFLGSAVLKVASFTPSYWYVKANSSIHSSLGYNARNVNEVFGYMAIQVGFAAVFIAIALVVSKRKSQQAN